MAVGLHLGCAICEAHACLFGATVDLLVNVRCHAKTRQSTTSCLAQQLNPPCPEFQSFGYFRAEIPSVREPSGLSRDDGKRPDALTLVPWQSGRSATWNVTVVHTLAASYVSQSAVQAGSAATAASVRKSANYSSLSSSHIFCPVAVETLGPRHCVDRRAWFLLSSLCWWHASVWIMPPASHTWPSTASVGVH